MQATTSAPLRIAVWHNLPSGGASRSLHQHINGLVERGHHVEVWCPPTADSSFLNVGGLVRQHVVPFDSFLPPAYRWQERLLALRYVNDTLMNRMDAHCHRCAADIGAGQFDVVYMHSCQTFTVPFLAKYLRLPKVLYLHEPARGLYEVWPDRLCWEAPSRDKRGLSAAAYFRDLVTISRHRVRVREERKNVGLYDRVLVNSIFSNEAMLRIYGRSGEVCRLGVDASLFPNLNLPRENFVMGLGTIHPHKGLEMAVLAVASIRHNRPRLVWVGNSSDAEYLEKVRRLADAKEVRLEIRKLVPQAELVQLLNKARCLLCTSKLEPLGLAPLEANSCGLPVVAVEEGGLRETIIHKQTGLLVPRNAVRLGQAVSWVLADDTLFGELSRNATRHIREHWSLTQSIDNIEDVLLEAATRTPERAVLTQRER